MLKKTLATALLCSAVVSTGASAAPYMYTLTTPGNTFKFTIDDANPPSGPGKGGEAFSYDQVAVESSFDESVTSIGFFDLASGGGLFVNGRYTGPQLYAGDVEMPTLLTGDFLLVAEDGETVGRLSVTTGASGVPEPASWGMMVLGFGLVGAGLRSRRRTTVRFA